MIEIQHFNFNPVEVNTYVVYSETKECFIVDPGCYTDSEFKKLFSFIESNNLVPKAIVLTHFHFDHLMGAAKTAAKYKIDIAGHQDYKLLFEQLDLKTQANYFNLEFELPPSPKITLTDKQVLTLGENKFEVLHIPGHSPCGIALSCKESKIVIVGDILFNGSIGRTDFYMGNMNLLLDGIKTKLFSLDDETVVYSGHGRPTTIGNEKIHNPFF